MPRPHVAVNAIIFTDHHTVLLTRRADNGLWCLPGGMVEERESLSGALVRELREEIHIISALIRCTGIYSLPNVEIIPPARGPLIVIAFECAILGGTPTTSDEVIEVASFHISSLPSLLPRHRDRIFHALTSPLLPYID